MLTEELTTEKIKDLKKPVPVNQESPFTFEELFFSVTDPKSNITYANEVFVRISKYEKEEVIGQLHKLIRHPDMPRSVFNIFWDHLNASKPVAAYVKNMAKDGSYYWVLALAFPCKGGYLSIRLKPGSELFNTVKECYAKTLQFEKRKEQQLGDKKKAMEESRAFLLNLLKKEGFADYREFMWNALQKEMSYRESILSQGMSEEKKKTEKHIVPPVLVKVETILSELVLGLENLQNIHNALIGHSDYILKLARSILLLSLNAQISSSKLDQDDMLLSVVAEKMGEQSVDGEKRLINMKENIHHLSDLIAEMNFEIISSKIQVEMTIDFFKELEKRKFEKEISLIKSDEVINLLYDAFMPRLDVISKGIGKVPAYLRDLMNGVKDIERFLLVLRFIHITGKVEVARMNDDANSFSTTFQDLVNEIETADSHLRELNEVVSDNKDSGLMYTAYQERLTNLIANIDRR
ncbi:PAS domain-containing protein [Gracilimonas sediminicola]|uniref:PAS domain-containing protein n=1 Tax=Gracilimonas sediminicola TaxID=2952158 RepID=UPI0038D4FC6C